MESHRFIRSSRGGELLLYNNHIFRLHLKYHETTFWKCVNGSCPARAKTKSSMLAVKGDHNHTPNLNRLRKLTIYNVLKSKSETEMSESIPKIYRQVIQKVAEKTEEAAFIPSLKAASSVMYRARAKLLPPVPKIPREKYVIIQAEKSDETPEGQAASETSIDKRKFPVVDSGSSILKKKIDGSNDVERETVTSDIEMQSDGNSESGPSSSFMSTSGIVVKEEIIESEEEFDDFDDLSFNSTFDDNSIETHSDRQTPSTSYLAHSETSSSSASGPIVVQNAGAMAPKVPQNMKADSYISTNFCDLSSRRDVSLSKTPSSLNVTSPDVISREDSRSVNSPIPPVLDISGSENSSITEPNPSETSSTLSSAPPQVLNTSSLPSSNNNMPMQPSAPPNQNFFRPLKDKFDSYGEFIAAKLRKLDPKSCNFIQTTLADLIFKAELGMFSNNNGGKNSVSAFTNNNTQRDVNTISHSQSESTCNSSGKENTQPTAPQLPPNFQTIGSEGPSRNVPNQPRIPPQMPNPTFPPIPNYTNSQNSVGNAFSQPRITSCIGGPWPSPVTNIASVNNPNSPQNRVPFRVAPPSAPPVFIPSNSHNHLPIYHKVPIPMRLRDDFDTFGEFVATKLRTLDPKSRAFIETTFATLIFEAELGRFLSEGERSILANRTNEIVRNMPPANISELNSLTNVVSNISRYVAQSQWNSAPVGIQANQVPLEVNRNLHTVPCSSITISSQ